MAKASPTHRCSECGWTTSRWVGRCPQCQAWGSIAETAPERGRTRAVAPGSKAVSLRDVPLEPADGCHTGLGELDRVLGGGLVPGAVVLLAGEPGVGKSTLLLAVAGRWAEAGKPTLYVTAEESPGQVKLRAERTDVHTDGLFLAAESDLGTILGHIEALAPSLLVLDSVQTVHAPDVDGIPGGVTQVREVTAALVRVAKQRGMPVIIVGHVTKDGSVAGPRTLEHLVDIVLSFEGDRHSGFRMVRASKNRFGPADEVGCFEMTEDGIRQVPDPSGLFLSERAEGLAGTCISVTLEGRRPLLAEVQALVAPSRAASPRRVSHGLDSSRVAVILAVLQRKAGLRLHDREVYATTVAGGRITDPAADLALAIAIASAAAEWPAPVPLVALGEVGLSGDLRRVAGLERRLGEAARLGFGTALVPRGSRVSCPGLRVVEVGTVAEALGLLQIRPMSKKFVQHQRRLEERLLEERPHLTAVSGSGLG